MLLLRGPLDRLASWVARQDGVEAWLKDVRSRFISVSGPLAHFCSVSADAMTALMHYRWPGNVRELEHAVERAVILANNPNIRVRDLPPEITQQSRGRGGDTLDLQEQERVMIERALERFGGNRRKAAEALNISTVTLWRKMKQFGISS